MSNPEFSWRSKFIMVLNAIKYIVYTLQKQTNSNFQNTEQYLQGFANLKTKLDQLQLLNEVLFTFAQMYFKI